MKPLPRILARSIAALLVSSPALAVIETWDGGGADNNLSTALNWLDNTAAVSDLVNTDLIFAGSVRLTPNLSTPFSTDSLTFNNTAGSFVIGGQVLTVGAGGIVNSDAQTQSFTNVVQVGAAATTFSAAAGGLAFGNNVALGTNALSLTGAGAFSFNTFGGSGSVTKAGAGTMTWSPIGTESLDLVVNAGTVNTVADGTTDTFDASSSISVNGISTLNLGENTTLAGGTLSRVSGATLTIAAGKTLVAQSGADVMLTNGFGNIGGGNITITGAGTTLNATTSFAFNDGGTFTLNGGATANVQANFDIVGSSVLVDGAGTVLTGGTSNNWGAAGDLATLTFSNTASAAFDDVLLSATNAANGTAGIVLVQSGADLTLGTLQVAVFNAGLTGVITVEGAGSTVTQSGASQITLGSASTSSATINVNNGGVYHANSTQVNSTGTINLGGGTFNAGGNFILNGALNRTGSGVFNLAAGNSFNAQNGAQVNFGTGDLIASGASVLSFVGAGTLYNGSFLTTLGAGSSINVAAGAVVNINGNGTLQALAGDVEVSGSGSQLNVLGNAASTIGANGGNVTTTFRSNATGTFLNGLQIGILGGNITGVLAVQSGADVTAGTTNIATSGAGNVGALTVTGAGSTFTVTGTRTLTLGAASGTTGALNVLAGGVFNSSAGNVTVNPTGVVTVSGGTYQANGFTSINGGDLNFDSTGIFIQAPTTGLSVSNAGSINAAGNLSLGFGGNSTLSLLSFSGNSQLTVAGNLGFGRNTSTNFSSGADASVGTFSFTPIAGQSVSLSANGVGTTLTETSAAGTTWGSGGDVFVSFSNNAAGSFGGLVLGGGFQGGSAELNVRSGADVTVTNFFNLATFDIPATADVVVQDAGSTLSVGSFVLGSAVAGSGTLTIGNGATASVTSASASNVIESTGTLTLDGGTLNVTNTLTRNGGAFNFTAGTLNLGGGIVVEPAGLLGGNPTISASQIITAGSGVLVQPFRTLTIDGGTLTTGVLINSGSVDFKRGTLGITGGAGFTIGTGAALGASITLGTGARLAVSNTAQINAEGVLTLSGGRFEAGSLINAGSLRLDLGAVNVSGSVNNAGGAQMFLSDTFTTAGNLTNGQGARLTLRDGTGRLAGAGTFGNSGLLTGDGTITKPLTNSATGEVRAESGRTLSFTAAATNGGQFNLLGGTLDFASTLTNHAAGFISGRGALFTGGLANSGVLAFSGGNTDLRGDVTNAAGARIVTSGAGATTTFFDDVIHNGLEIFTGPGASTVFFGDQSGVGNFTGTGTVFYIGDLRPGNSPAEVHYEGDLIFGSAASLTFEIGGLTPGSGYDRLEVAGTLFAGGWLKVTLLDGFAPASGDTFDFFDAGAVTGAFAAIELPALSAGLAWDAPQIARTGEAAVIPEPASAALLAAGLLSFLLLPRRRGRPTRRLS